MKAVYVVATKTISTPTQITQNNNNLIRSPSILLKAHRRAERFAVPRFLQISTLYFVVLRTMPNNERRTTKPIVHDSATFSAKKEESANG